MNDFVSLEAGGFIWNVVWQSTYAKRPIVLGKRWLKKAIEVNLKDADDGVIYIGPFTAFCSKRWARPK